MIIETTAGQKYRVRETNSDDLAHVWFGIEVKKVGASYEAKKNAREILVRKAGAVQIAA